MPNRAVAGPTRDPAPAPLKAPRHIVAQLLNQLPRRAVICDAALRRVLYANALAMRWGLSQWVGLQMVARPLLTMDEHLRQHSLAEPQDLPIRFIGHIAQRRAVIEIHALHDEKGMASHRLLLW